MSTNGQQNGQDHAENPPSPPGGLGGDMEGLPESIRPGPGIRDTRLIQRAIEEGWPVEQQYRKALINRQVSIGINPELSPRESTSAFMAILQASRQNLEIVKAIAGVEKSEGPALHLHQHNEQIVVYVPDNGRDARVIESSSNGNGHSH